MNEVAVVVLNYNGKDLLRQFLPSVIRHTPARIVVADNGSTDESIKVLQNEFPQVEILPISANLGFCGGYNFALKKIKAAYYVLLNSDVEVTTGWLESLIAVLKTNPKAAAAQPKILSYHRKTHFEYAGAAGGYIDSLGYPFCRGRIFETIEEDLAQYNDSRQVFWATGACMAIRAEAYHILGGLDEDFFAHMEEIDLCWKLNRSGQQVWYVGNSTVYHVGGGTLSSGSPRKTYFNFRNGLSLLFHHLPGAQLIWKIPFRLLLDWVAAVRFLVSAPRSSLAILRAHVHFAARIGATLRKRANLKKQLGSFAAQPIYPGLLIAGYFLGGKKTFKDLGKF